jgi:hypothetical protein
MIVNFTVPPSQYNPSWMSQTLDAVKRTFSSAISKSEAAPRILLQSPNGTIYAVTVSDTGTLAIAAEPGKDRKL